MHLAELKVYFDTSPTVALLRSANAPYVLDFFRQAFKRPGRISIPHSELRVALKAYQDEVRALDPDGLPQSADAYLASWCAPEKRWLSRRLQSGLDEHVYQLTRHSEAVFTFLERASEGELGFVGTESRLKLIVDTLSDLVVSASDDPEQRLAHLRQQADEIAAEIAQVEAEGDAPRMRPAQIRERFMTAVSLLKQLKGDFRAVEESFRRITADVQSRQIEGRQTRGKILEYALDAEDLLKMEDQGVSFYAFVQLILSPQQTARLERVVEQVHEIPELAEYPESLETLRGMITLLQNEAQNVMRTNQRLSATLRRLLDAKAHEQRQRVAQVLQEIRAHAVAQAAEPPRLGITVEADLDIESPFRRPFWNEPTRFESIDLTEHEATDEARQEAFRNFAAMHRLDWKAMRARIRSLLQSRTAPTLGDLLRLHPPRAGVIEAMGYLQIARDDGHLVDPTASEKILLEPIHEDDPCIELTIPLVTFMSGPAQDGESRP